MFRLCQRTQKAVELRMTVIPVVIAALGTVPKGLERGLEELEISGRIETTQITALLRCATILLGVLKTWEDLLSLRLHLNIIS